MDPGHGEKLTRKRELLVAALLVHPTLEAAARSVGVSDTTAARWRDEDPEFSSLYRAEARKAMRHASARLRGVSQRAVDALEECLGDKGAGWPARVAAAKIVLEMAVRAANVDDLQERLDAVERALGVGQGPRAVA